MKEKKSVKEKGSTKEKKSKARQGVRNKKERGKGGAKRNGWF